MWSINPMTPPRPTLNHMAPPDLVSVEESRRLAGRTSNICRLTRLKASSSHSNHPLPKPKNGKHLRLSEKATKISLPLHYQPRLKKPALPTRRLPSQRLPCLKIFPSLDHVHCRKLKVLLVPHVVEVSKGYRAASSAASHRRTLPFHDDLPPSNLQILIKSSSKHGKNPNSTLGAVFLTAFLTAMRTRLSLSKSSIKPASKSTLSPPGMKRAASNGSVKRTHFHEIVDTKILQTEDSEDEDGDSAVMSDDDDDEWEDSGSESGSVREDDHLFDKREDTHLTSQPSMLSTLFKSKSDYNLPSQAFSIKYFHSKSYISFPYSSTQPISPSADSLMLRIPAPPGLAGSDAYTTHSSIPSYNQTEDVGVRVE